MDNSKPLPPEKLNPAEEWASWKPSGADPFDARWAGHLYRRAGFGATPVELQNAIRDGLDATLERMFSNAKTPAKPAPIQNPTLPAGAIQIRVDWLQRMLSGSEPIRERLTFFWHNHFATSIAKIKDARLMQRQNDLIRKYALGKFGPFLREMSRDAAMLIWLDSNQNVKSHPNENFAREVMELFSLGVGNYTEKDVQDAARAFTGWHVTNPQEPDPKYVFHSNDHDHGTKKILGQTGEWDGDDVIRILLEQPACSKFLVRKLYAFLIDENVAPPDALIQPLARDLQKADYDVGVTVRTILKSRHFYSAHAYRQKVKSPIDYILGVARMLGTSSTGAIVMSPHQLIGSLELQGQQLYQPPNVKGWEGGKAWLNTATVLARHNFGSAIANGMKELNLEALKSTGATFVVTSDPLPRILDMVRRAHKIDPEDLPEPVHVVDYLSYILLQDDLTPKASARMIAHLDTAGSNPNDFRQCCRDVLAAILTLPEYQLN